MSKSKETERPYYEEWRVDIINGKVSKLAKKRERVLITDEQAAVLNEGTLTGFSTAPCMYFKPGVDQPTLPQKEVA